MNRPSAFWGRIVSKAGLLLLLAPTVSAPSASANTGTAAQPPQVIPAAPPTTPPTTSPTTQPPVLPPAAKPALPQPITVPPPVDRPQSLPFPSLPFVPLDANDDLGIAQSVTHARGLQARILWIDATANIDKYNTAPKIDDLTAQIKSVGFNTIVFDIKPIIGYTVYPSRYAPKLTEWVRPWKTQTLPIDFDPLKEMATAAHAQGLNLIVSCNAFSEGHREFGKGPGYDHPDWQTVLYEPEIRVRRDTFGTPGYIVTDRANVAPRSRDDLSIYTDLTRIPTTPDALVALLDANGNVLLQVTGAALKAMGLKAPTGGAALVGLTPTAATFLRTYALPGYKVTIDTQASYVPISQRPDRQVPLMTNPNNPAVRQRLLDMLTEIATTYPIDGLMFDDRLRYASINADFSDLTRKQFEQYLGSGVPGQEPAKVIRWPDDVFHYNVDFPSLERTLIPGPYFDAWLAFRALTLRNFFADAVRTVKTARPTASVGTYVGSWYPDYPDLGANWGADDLQAGFHFLNDSYRRTGWAGLADFVITGCYYQTATIGEAQMAGQPVGETVEAAGQFSNRAVNDQTFVYAGISLDQFKGNREGLRKVLQAAAATTQGIMCFDLSHDIDPLWSIFADAFSKPAQSPNQIPGLVDQVRAQHASQKAAGVPTPPVILYRGTSGTGF